MHIQQLKRFTPFFKGICINATHMTEYSNLQIGWAILKKLFTTCIQTGSEILV